ncbi:MAG: sensor domain-containing diguanylate cyclase [bacterium]|nr:sensor domain-containing diguanylate cyclase [bacterium]
MNAMQKIGPPENNKSTQLLQDSDLLATIIDTIHTGVALLDPQGRFVHVNQAYCDIQGWTPKDLLGQRYVEKIRLIDEQSYLQDLHDVVFQGLTVRPHEVMVHRPDRRMIWTEVACRLIVHGERSYCLISIQDITERKQLEEGLQSLATTDSLTGIANRRHFFELSRIEMKRVKRSRKSPTLLMIDLDNFKDLNDVYGHAAGDQVLAHFATICQESLRESDVFGRLGGEEFAVLLPETSPRRAQLIAERLRLAFAKSCAESCSQLRKTIDEDASKANRSDESSATICTASFGVAAVAAGESSVEPAMHRADVALYAAKEAGRNRVIVARPPAADE